MSDLQTCTYCGQECECYTQGIADAPFQRQSVGSNHASSPQDADSPWLTQDERDKYRPALSRRYIMHQDNDVPGRGEQKMLQIHDLLEHAALADELINELAAALHQQIGLHYQGWTDPGNAMSNAKNVLRRVDAIRKQTP